jgi:uncharacterized protein YcfL
MKKLLIAAPLLALLLIGCGGPKAEPTKSITLTDEEKQHLEQSADAKGGGVLDGLEGITE